jgi:hypothetical protein
MLRNPARLRDQRRATYSLIRRIQADRQAGQLGAVLVEPAPLGTPTKLAGDDLLALFAHGVDMPRGRQPEILGRYPAQTDNEAPLLDREVTFPRLDKAQVLLRHAEQIRGLRLRPVAGQPPLPEHRPSIVSRRRVLGAAAKRLGRLA